MTISGATKLENDKKADKWIGEDDKNITRTSVFKSATDKNGFKGIALEPMRIRTFVIDWNEDAKDNSEMEK